MTLCKKKSNQLFEKYSIEKIFENFLFSLCIQWQICDKHNEIKISIGFPSYQPQHLRRANLFCDVIAVIKPSNKKAIHTATRTLSMNQLQNN